MEEKSTNPLSIVSLVAGIAAIFGHVCCCIPFLGVFFGLIVILLEAVAIISGVIARSQAEEGQNDTLAMVGIAAGAVAALMSITFVILTFSAGMLDAIMS